jgi:hypothetical protein
MAAATALAASAVAGLVFLEWPLSVVPLIVALLSGAWILSRPSE